jgi:hypothetical protein
MDCDDAVAQQDEDCADAVALEDGRCIMVETNFRVYAYTSSTLQEQILRLFTQVTMRIRTHDSRRLVSGSDVNCGPREQVQYSHHKKLSAQCPQGCCPAGCSLCRALFLSAPAA